MSGPPASEGGVRRGPVGAAFLILAWTATAGALVIWLTGGFRHQLLGVRVSASNLDRPAVLAILLWTCLAARWPLALPRVRPLPLVVAVACLAGTFMARHAAPFAAGADMYGYVAQAADWRSGSLRHPVTPPAPASFPDHAYVPLGYTWQYPPPSAVALYPPGTSLHMAAASLVHPAAIYVVSPLAALLVIVGTYRLGRVYFGAETGAWAALLVAMTPQLLMQGLVPMGDTLAAAYWVWALACAAIGTRGLQALAGLLASVAIIVRPNLAPLLAAVLMCSAWSGGLRASAVAAAAALPLVAWLAWHNTQLFGAPLATGYGSTSALFAWAHAPDNLRRYGTWLAQTLTPIPVIGVVAFLVGAIRRRTPEHAGLLLFVGGTCLAYLWYLPWPNWTFSRFLLPALPVALLMTVATLRHLPTPPAAAVGIVGLMLGWQMHFVQNSDVRNVRLAMSRFEALGEHLGAQPRRGAVITRLHSGSLRYYASAITVRWDQLSRDELRAGIAREIALGRRPLLVDDADDRAAFEDRFGPVGCWADTSTPVFVLQRHAEVRLLAARAGCDSP